MSDEAISLRIEGVDYLEETTEGTHRLSLRTTRGPIPIIFHPASSATRGVLCVCGARGGFDGPQNLYVRMGRELPSEEIGLARLNYRMPGDFAECALDALAGLMFLKGIGYSRTAIVGHSFGGAIAINTATLSSSTATVIAISSQLAGAHVVDQLAPKPLLLIHGTSDEILPHRSSELIFERARGPKRLHLVEHADHRLTGHGDEIFTAARDWIAAHL